MTQFRPMEIDFDIHKLIEGERRGFEDSPNSALRRLLKLPDKEDDGDEMIIIEGFAPWSGEGASLPHGTALQMIYGDERIEGRIRNGKWVCGDKDQVFDTPSAAASALARTKDGQTTNLNGWNYWQVKFPGNTKWIPLKELRGGGFTNIFGKKRDHVT
jgi:hypothetical protein